LLSIQEDFSVSEKDDETFFKELWATALSDMDYLINHWAQLKENSLCEDENAGLVTELHQSFSEIINKLWNHLDREEVQLGLLSKFVVSGGINEFVPDSTLDDRFRGQFPELDGDARDILNSINFFITSITQSEHKKVIEMFFKVHLDISEYADRARDLASNQHTPPEMIEIFLQSEFESVFEIALQNSNCSSESLRRLYEGDLEFCLYSGDDDLVIETLAQHRNTPIDILQILGADEESEYATAARANIASRYN
jgi:hypothetical protein